MSTPDPNSRVSPIHQSTRLRGCLLPLGFRFEVVLWSCCPVVPWSCGESPRLAETLKSQNREERCTQPTPIPSQGSAFFVGADGW